MAVSAEPSPGTGVVGSSTVGNRRAGFSDRAAVLRPVHAHRRVAVSLGSVRVLRGDTGERLFRER